MPSIEFVDITMEERTRLSATCKVHDDSDESWFKLWFEFSDSIAVTNDAIAVAFSTLCGRAYSDISYDIEISERARKDIHAFTLASVSAKIRREYIRPGLSGHTLSFSGGFDSLAALSLMPQGTRLVSMDFGGRFARERTFFESFDTTIVSTNLLETPLRKNSWSFMGIGAILLNDHYTSRYHTFGSILEAGADNLRQSPTAAANVTFPPFRAAGFVNAPYVAGLTEVGTLMALQKHNPQLIGPSLSSLASPGEEKLYRKKVLAEIVSERTGNDFFLPEVQMPPVPHFKFGQNFAIDFLSFYVGKYRGLQDLSTMVADVPPNLVALARRLDLTLFERANTTLYSRFPRELVGGLAGQLAEADMPFYTEKDWVEYQQIRDFLLAYHPVVAT